MSLQVLWHLDYARYRVPRAPVTTLSRIISVRQRLSASVAVLGFATPSSRLIRGVTVASSSLPGQTMALGSAPTHGSRWTTTALTLLTLLLFVSITTACGGGGSLTGGGDPLSIIAPEAFEIEIYSVDAYLAQDLPDKLRESFIDLQQDFERFGIAPEDVDQLAIAVLSCCSYREVDSAPGPRVYVLDGSIDLDAVRDSLEREGFQSRMYGDIEAWEKRALEEKFRGFDSLGAAFLTEEGYLVIGAVDGIRELIHELPRASEDDADSYMEEVLARVGDDWKARGRLDAQTRNTLNTHCAQSVQHKQRCDATAYYTSYANVPFGTKVLTLYGSVADAESESEKSEDNFEKSEVYESVDVEIVELTVADEFVEAIEHDRPLRRRWSNIF